MDRRQQKSEKSSPQIQKLHLAVASKRPQSPVHDSSEAESPLTARKMRTSETRLGWARRIMWGEAQDCRDEHYTPSELLTIAEEEQALILEAFAVLYLHNTSVQNQLDKETKVRK